MCNMQTQMPFQTNSYLPIAGSLSGYGYGYGGIPVATPNTYGGFNGFNGFGGLNGYGNLSAYGSLGGYGSGLQFGGYLNGGFRMNSYGGGGLAQLGGTIGSVLGSLGDALLGSFSGGFGATGGFGANLVL